MAELSEDERAVADRANQIGAELLKHPGFSFDIFYEEDGEQGWHITIQAGQPRYITGVGQSSEYVLAYWTRDNAWYWETVNESGNRSGPWPCRDLDGNAAAVEVAEYVKAGVSK